jgi:hypothetical protein
VIVLEPISFRFAAWETLVFAMPGLDPGHPERRYGQAGNDKGGIHFRLL